MPLDCRQQATRGNMAALPAVLRAAGTTRWSSPCPRAGKSDMMRPQVSMQGGRVGTLCAESSGRLWQPGMLQAVLRPQARLSRGRACVKAWCFA